MMTKIKILFVIGCILLSSCSGAQYDNPTIREYTYKGHNYLIFTVDGNYGQTYVHDPDCPCHNKIK